MRVALAPGKAEIQAGADAPRDARCPCCGEAVELQSQRGGWYYRHAPGTGISCPARKKPVRRWPQEPEPVLPAGDPEVVLAMAAVERAVFAARRGDLAAVLDLAFSSLVHQALDVAGLTPEEVLEVVLPVGEGEAPEVLVTTDEAAVLERVQAAPGPVLDVRSWHDGHIAELRELDWYVRLWPVGPAKARMVRRVVRLATQVYVLGEPEEWAAIGGRCRGAA